MSNDESYETTSGLVDDFDLEIVDAWFATDSRYNNGQTSMLFWKVNPLSNVDDSVPPEFWDGGIRFACGKDWESSDGGKTVAHPGGTKKFNAQSAYGMLINRAVELGAGDVLKAKGPTQDASIWPGLRFHMKREEYSFNIKGEEVKRDRLLPTSFDGVGDGTATASTPAAAATPKASALEGMDEAVVEKLRGLKADTADHSAFVDAVMDLPDLSGDTKVVMAIATPDGVYAEL